MIVQIAKPLITQNHWTFTTSLCSPPSPYNTVLVKDTANAVMRNGYGDGPKWDDNQYSVHTSSLFDTTWSGSSPIAFINRKGIPPPPPPTQVCPSHLVYNCSSFVPKHFCTFAESIFLVHRLVFFLFFYI